MDDAVRHSVRTFSMNVKMYRIVRWKPSSSIAWSPTERWLMTVRARARCKQDEKQTHEIAHAPSGRLLYIALSFVERSVKKSFARSAIRGSSSSRHFAISPSWPLTLIMPFRMRCVRTISVFFFTTKSMSERPRYNSSLFSSMIVLNDTATSPSAIAMLLRMFASFDVSRIRKRRWWFVSQKFELMQRNLLNDSVATARSVVFCPKARVKLARDIPETDVDEP